MTRAAKFLAVIPFVAAVCGCGQGSPSASVTATPVSTAQSEEDLSSPFPAPDIASSELALLADSGARIPIGGDEDAFKNAFPRPALTSISINDLPPGATADHWSATGWEFENAARGVGALLYDHKIAVAMREIDNVAETDIQSEIDMYQKAFGEPQAIGDAHTRYWFWQNGSGTLMICAFTDGHKQTNLTTAVGDTAVMTRLRMTPGPALQDRATVEKINGGAEAPKPANAPG